MNDNILIIAPHPDDEVLGCGASIARFVAEGHNVYVLVATRGSNRLYDQQKVENVRDEAREAHKMLGVKETQFLGFPAPELDTVPVADIAREFSKVINQFAVTKLFLPHRGDIHNDHSVVFNAGLVAARPVNNCTVKQIYAYETLSETEWAAPYSGDAFIPNVYIDVSLYFDKKIEAFGCFKSQLRSFPNPRSFEALLALASFRGSTIGVKKAEAFMCVRIVN
jgi:LmbE family N-acetylglucosaminyl deacetylase